MEALSAAVAPTPASRARVMYTASIPGQRQFFNAQLPVEMVIPPKVFAGWPFVKQVNYTNPGRE